MAAKRPASDAGGAPPLKKVALGPIDIGPSSGEEDLDMKILQVQNKKLAERLRARNRIKEELEARLEKLEHSHDCQIKFMVGLKHHVTVLKDHLLAMLAPLGAESVMESLTEEMLDGLSQGAEGASHTLEKVFESVYSAIQRAGVEGMRRLSESLKETADMEEKVQALSEVHGKVVSLLGELQTRHDLQELQKLRETTTTCEAKCEEMEGELGEARFDLQKALSRCDQLEVQLGDALEELRQRPTIVGPHGEEKGESKAGGGSPRADDKGSEDKSTVSTEEVDQLRNETLEARALAESRLAEVGQLSQQLQEAKKALELARLERSNIPEAAVKETPAYKTLQLQYSVAYQEVTQLQGYVEDARRLLNTAKSQHLMQLEEIRGEEVKYQVEVREEMAQLETALASTKRDYEMLRIEFEKTVASNEQAAPIAKELQVTVDSLHRTVQQLRSELGRYKHRAHKAEQQVAKTQEEKESEKPPSTSEVGTKAEAGSEGAGGEKERSQDVQELHEKVKTLTEEKRAMEAQLEAFRQAGKEEREKAEILAAEKKYRAQVEELKRKFEEYRKDYEKRKEHIREEASRKSKALAEDNKHLQKELSAKKQEAQALVSEMECTAQAFEEMQEQNIRLLMQLKEKDDANFKLMSERIKYNSVQKVLLEEKELLQSQINAINTEKARLNDLVCQLEERERNSEAVLQSSDKEATLKQQALELHKKKALESVQSLQEAQLRLSELEKQVQTAQQALQDKTEESEKETQILRRSQEEVSTLKRKLEKYKSREWAATSDEVLLEEIKTYKSKLNCPCCSARKKDTVLTKCFHVFCSECIRSRYDSRLRKCPKCGAAFGANDFHKIYLS